MADRDKMIKFLMCDFQDGHSEYQIRNFIIGSEVHPWHQYQQCLREIKGRWEAICDQREILKSIDSEISRSAKKRLIFFGKKKNKISKNLKKRNRILKSISKNERELDLFLEIAVPIRKEFGKDLTLEKIKYLESDAWRKKAEFMMCLDIYCIGRPSRQTIEFIYKLPKEIKREIIIKFGKVDQKTVLSKLIE